MSFTTFSLTMEDMKSEDSVQAPWQGFRNPLPVPTRLVPSYDLVIPSSLGSLYKGISGENYLMSNRPEHAPRNKDQPDTSPRPHLKSHHSYPSLKRSHQTFEEMQYSDSVPELFDAAPESESQSKPSIGPDHRLLSFGRTQMRQAILDQYGRRGSIEISAQIHGMFFLSEMATTNGEAMIVKPELTCYRRNLFQISGSVSGPTGPVSVETNRGHIPIVSREITISATESVDGHAIRLIVIPWKTPPPNSPEVPPNQEQEPLVITLSNHAEGVRELNGEVIVHPIAWRRMQFRVATANNGRRKELQQHFILRLNLTATLADGTKLCLAETATAPIVVRGRSPRNFQARKEIPLVGSSASFRGLTAQNSSLEKKVASLSDKGRIRKRQSVELPKRPFQFDASSFPQSPQMLRHSFSSQWTTSPQASGQGTAATTPTYNTPQIVLPGYLHTSHPSSDAPHMHTPVSQSQHASSNGTLRPAFYQMTSAPPASSLSIPFLDHNPRPTKSPRHAVPADQSALPLYSPYDGRGPSPYTVLSQAGDASLSSREYFPVTLASDPWTTAENGGGLYSTSMPPGPQENYTFSAEPFVREDAEASHYTWNTS